MIRLIRGKVLEKKGTSIILLVNGIGIEIITTPKVISSVQVNEEIELYTCVYIPRGPVFQIHIYGFLEKEERDIFEKLISIPMVGPTKVLKLLSYLPYDRLEKIIQEGNIIALANIKGIGPKVAERLIVEGRRVLQKKKVKPLELPMLKSYPKLLEKLNTAREVLQSLEFQEREIERVIEDYISVNREKLKEIENMEENAIILELLKRLS